MYFPTVSSSQGILTILTSAILCLFSSLTLPTFPLLHLPSSPSTLSILQYYPTLAPLTLPSLPLLCHLRTYASLPLTSLYIFCSQLYNASIICLIFNPTIYVPVIPAPPPYSPCPCMCPPSFIILYF